MLWLYWSLVALMGIGVIGAVIPGVPGTGVIVVAIALWGFTQGFAGVWLPLGVAIAIFILSSAVDFLATFWGLKKAGASHWGQIGAMVGLVAGVLGFLPALPVGGPLLGLLIGPFLGALIGEFLYCRDLRIALKAAIAVIVTTVVGNIIQGFLALGAVIVFLITTWPLG